MIEELMPITENKLKILKHIYEHEDSYLLSAAKELGIHPFSLKRTIDNLVNKGVLATKPIGKTIILSLNTTFHDYTDLLCEIEKYKLKTENRMLKKLYRHVQLAFSKDERILTCVLFGSWARDAQTTESDVDIFFIVATEKAKHDIIKKCIELSLALGVDIAPIVFDKKSFRTALETKEPAMLSMLKPAQRTIIFGIEAFLKLCLTSPFR